MKRKMRRKEKIQAALVGAAFLTLWGIAGTMDYQAATGIRKVTGVSDGVTIVTEEGEKYKASGFLDGEVTMEINSDGEIVSITSKGW